MSEGLAIREAFKRAGYVDPGQRLLDIANGILAELPRDWDYPQYVSEASPTDPNYPKLKEIAMSLRAKHTGLGNWETCRDKMFAAVRNDAALLWALFEPYRSVAVDKVLRDAASEEHQRKRKEAAAEEARQRKLLGDGGQRLCESQATSAPSRNNEDGGAVCRMETSHCMPRRPTHSTTSRAASNAAAVAAVKATFIETYLVGEDKIPLGQCSPEYARSHMLNLQRNAKDMQRHARFLDLVTSNLPRGEPIGKYVTPEQAEAYWKQSAENCDVE